MGNPDNQMWLFEAAKKGNCMKTTYRAAGGNFVIDEECADIKEAFAFVSECDEVFGADLACSNCKGTNLRPKYRNVKGYEYYSLRCENCNWEFKYGQTKDEGRLFPKGWEPPYEQPGKKAPAPAPGNAAKRQLEEDAPF